jgi:hypothetical protein
MVPPKDKIAYDHHTLRAFFLLLPCVRVYEYDVNFLCMELCMFGDMYSKYRISNWYVLHEAVAYDAKIIQALDYCDSVTQLFAKQYDILWKSLILHISVSLINSYWSSISKTCL